MTFLMERYQVWMGKAQVRSQDEQSCDLLISVINNSGNHSG
jgi:hypothetical protein